MFKVANFNVHELERLISLHDNQPFSDIAFCLYQFIKCLYFRSKQDGVRELYFLSREGWDLKELFEIYQSDSNSTNPIQVHYLEASRRSSFLPSLRCLSEETFEVLFRQYRRMSLESFLNSLGLEAYGNDICEALKLDQQEYHEQREDFSTDPLFEKLKRSPFFEQVYDRERKSRSAVLKNYISNFTDGILPKKLTLVDVGWKGSIQDNLYNWFLQQRGNQAQVQGYYIGLNDPGAISENNHKTGLLFRGYDGYTVGFNVFNENRSLFEVLLPARHGGPHSYENNSDGIHSVRREPYYEKEMVETHVQPISAEIREKFKIISRYQAMSPISDDAFFRLVCKRHARMVFNPRKNEIDWLLNINHRENFGVFGNSVMVSELGTMSVLERVCFTWRLVRYRRYNELGFWPYLTLKKRGIYGLSTIYRLFRAYQEILLRILTIKTFNK